MLSRLRASSEYSVLVHPPQGQQDSDRATSAITIANPNQQKADNRGGIKSPRATLIKPLRIDDSKTFFKFERTDRSQSTTVSEKVSTIALQVMIPPERKFDFSTASPLNQSNLITTPPAVQKGWFLAVPKLPKYQLPNPATMPIICATESPMSSRSNDDDIFSFSPVARKSSTPAISTAPTSGQTNDEKEDDSVFVFSSR